MTFPHPETGELLDSREDFDRAIGEVHKRMSPDRQLLNKLQAERAGMFPAAEQPARRYRTQTQEKVARCPRCGGALESEGAPEK